LKCPKCNFDNPAGMNFCGSCGSRLVNQCPQCKADLPGDFSFCGKCGARIRSGTEAVHRELTRRYERPPVQQAERPMSAPMATASDTERRIVTSLFADVTGFTSMSEGLDPEIVQEKIQTCFKKLSEIIGGYGGYVDKYMGDAVMALFGAPVSHEDDPERAVRAALEMQRYLGAASESPDSATMPIRMRIGVCTGEAVVGSISERGEKDYTAMGDAVNSAKRLQETAAPGAVVISSSTQRNVEKKFRLKPLPPLHVKGKKDPMNVFEVVGILHEREAFQTPFVGREAQLKRLVSIFQEALQKKSPCFVAVSGETGIGKSRLLHEFQAHIAGRYDATRFWTGKSLPYGNAPLLPVAEMIMNHFGVTESDPSATILKRFTDGLSAELDMPRDEAQEAAATMGNLFGMALPVSSALTLDSKEDRSAAFFTIKRIFETRAAKAPLVLSFEDLHRADSATLDFIEFLSTAEFSGPILVILLARPEVAELAPELWNGLQPIELSPLEAENSKVIVSSILGGKTVPRKIEKLVLEKTGGNPLFLEELTKSLIETGVLKEVRGEYVFAKSTEDFSIPETVHAVIAARVDSFSERERRVLRSAAVCGRKFWTGLLSRLCGGGVDEELRFLEESQLISQYVPSTFEDDREYQFKHALIQEVAYAGLLKRVKKELHKDIGEYLEARIGDAGSAQVVALAAYHFEMAEIHDHAAQFYAKAAALAEKGFSNEEAVGYFSKAIGLVHDAGFIARRAKLLSLMDRSEESYADLVEVEKLTKASGNMKDLAHAYRLMSNIHFKRAEYDKTMSTSEKAIEASRLANDPRGEAKSLLPMAQVALRRSEGEKALDYLKRAMDIYDKVGDTAGVSTCLDRIGNVKARQGLLDEAMAAQDRALALARTSGDNQDIVGSLNNLAISKRLARDYDGALKLHEEAMALMRKMGDRYGEATSLHNIGVIHAERNRYTVAISVWHQALIMRRQIADAHGAGSTVTNLGALKAQLGDYGGALEAVESALKIQAATEDPRMNVYALRTKGAVLRELQQFDAAGEIHDEVSLCVEKYRLGSEKLEVALQRGADLIETDRAAEAMPILEKVAALAKEEDDVGAEITAGIYLVHGHAMTGNLAAAADLAARCIEECGRHSRKELLPMAYLAAGRAAAMRGDGRKAAELFGSGIAILGELGSRRLLWQLHAERGHALKAEAVKAAGRTGAQSPLAEAVQEYKKARNEVYAVAATLPEGLKRGLLSSRAVLKLLSAAQAAERMRAGEKTSGE
jgi:adenylate cyclase